MAFASAISERLVMGNKLVNIGYFTNAGSGTGGDITVGMHRCEFFSAIVSYSAVGNAVVVNETFPVTGSGAGSAEVTIVTDGNVSGYWMAVGE